MPLTKPAKEVTEEDKANCIATRGHADETVTIYYVGEEDQVPNIQETIEEM